MGVPQRGTGGFAGRRATHSKGTMLPQPGKAARTRLTFPLLANQREMVFTPAGSNQSILTASCSSGFSLLPLVQPPAVPMHKGGHDAPRQTGQRFPPGLKYNRFIIYLPPPAHPFLLPIGAGDEAAQVTLSQRRATGSHTEFSRVTGVKRYLQCCSFGLGFVVCFF